MKLFSFLFGKNPEGSIVAEEKRAKGSLLPQMVSAHDERHADWSKANLKFLTGFLSGGEFKADSHSYWGGVLGEKPEKLVQRMLDAGLLAPAPLAAKIESAYKATEIKALLKERGLPVSGKKADLVARLIEADRDGMEAKAAHVTAYICTEVGRKLAEDYLASEKESRHQAHKSSLELLQAGQLRQAFVTVAEYERAQVFARGVGVDWSSRPSAEDLQQLQAILEAKPAILRDVSEADWPVLQRAAAMMELWGERSACDWLPSNFVGASNLDPETAVRMVLFAGTHHAKLRQIRDMGCKRVEVSGCGEASCAACQDLGGKKYRVSDVPDLPHPACTNEMGCRCIIVPAFD